MSKTIKKIAKVALPIAGAYFAPGIGSALGSTLGASTLGGIGGALGGAGGGILSGGGLKGALTGAALGGAGGYLGNGGFSQTFGSLPSGIQGAIRPGIDNLGQAGSGFLGSIGNATGLTSSGVGALTGGMGGSSTFGVGNILSSALGGAADDEALKKAQKQLLAGNQQQLANIESYVPGDYLSNPEYQFKQQEGEQAINRSLGAQGGLFSGNALKEAARYSQGLNTDFQQRDYQQYLNRIGSQNPIYANTANTNAATGIARSNNFGSTLSNILNPQPSYTLDDLLRLGRA